MTRHEINLPRYVLGILKYACDAPRIAREPRNHWKMYVSFGVGVHVPVEQYSYVPRVTTPPRLRLLRTGCLVGTSAAPTPAVFDVLVPTVCSVPLVSVIVQLIALPYSASGIFSVELVPRTVVP